MNKSVEKRASRNTWLLGSSSFLNDVGGDMIAPILPFYIISLGGGGVSIGLISGLREGLSNLFKVFGGWISDFTGKRKIFVFIGYFFSFIFKFLIGLANSWQQLIFFVSFERFGKFRDPPRDVIISESKERRGRNFGIIQMLDTLGSIFGTILVLLLFVKLGLNFKNLIFIAATLSFFSLIPIFFVKEPKSKKSKKSLFYGLKHMPKKLKFLIMIISIFSIANFGLYMFLLIIAQKMTDNFVFPFVFYTVFNLIFALFVVYFGRLSDRIGRKKVLLLGYFFFILVSLGFIFMKSILHLFLLFSAYGLVYAITHANHKAFVLDLSKEMKGTSIGFFYTITGLSNVLGGLIAGLLWEKSQSIMFAFIFFISLISFLLLVFFKEK
ncbi:MAG: MFS transporter [Candidatus Pacearchaeota archaeon]|nr:MAG: MFS transporter [Candidatus Pacearchaeota archaeon]